jgi:hypothetical protein
VGTSCLHPDAKRRIAEKHKRRFSRIRAFAESTVAESSCGSKVGFYNRS